MWTPPPTKKDAVEALEQLKNIVRPYGDNEGDSINSSTVYPRLSPQDQERVDRAEQIVGDYVRKPGHDGDECNRRSITELNKAGFPADFGSDQYDPNRLAGNVEAGDWTLDLSDPSNSPADD